jgi:autotransporter-associated beta strand protein
VNIKAILALTVGAIFSILSPASAANLYWDSNGTTAGAGGTPTGTWGVDNFWNTDSTGANLGAFQIGTLSTDDLFFSAGSDAINAYIISLNASTQNARLITFEDGTATLNNGTLSLGNGGGITVTSNTVTGATISSNLTISGSQTFNVAASRTLTLGTGTFTRNAGATLNVASTGTVTTTMTGLASGSMVNGIIGPWASYGSGASTKYATIDGSNNIVGLTGTAAATAANVTSTLGTLNYDVAAVGTLGAGASINTLRYTGAAGTIAGALTTKGIMNVGGGTLTLSGTVSGGGELVVNAANEDISFSSVLTSGTTSLVKTGSGRLNTANAATTFTGPVIVNGGVLQYGDQLGWLTSGNITLNGGVIEQRWTATNTLAQGSGAGQIQILGGESGFSENGNTGLTWNIGAVTWGNSTFNPSKFVLQTAASQGNSALTFSSSINLNGAERTIVANAGVTGGATSTLGGALSGTGASGLIKEGPGILILNVANSYSGNTTISAGTLRIAATDRLGSASNTLIFNGGTLQASGTVTSPSTRAVTMTQTGIFDTNGQAISIAGNIGGPGGLTKNGAGTLTLTGTNNYLGATTLTGGTLSVGAVNNLGNAASNLVFNGGTLQISNTTNLPNFSTLGRTVSFTSGQTVGLDVTSGTFTVDQVLNQGIGGLTKAGAGTLIFNQANTYTGATTVSAGTLQLDDGGVISPAPLFLNGGTFAVNRSATATQGSTLPALIGGTGSLANIGASTLVLNAPTFHTGNTTATAGNITLSHASAIQNSALNTTGNGTVTLSGVTTPTFGGLANSGTTRNLADVIDPKEENGNLVITG